jgi:RNA polymerase sigma factor (sigma-70 family)
MEPPTTPSISDEEFIEKYRRLCGHIAWDFVKRSHRDISPIALTQEDAEDFASCALIKLLKCPPKHRGSKYEKYYVQRIIENAITTAWRKRLKQMDNERDSYILVRAGVVSSKGGNEHANKASHGDFSEDIFDRLPGPDGLAGKTQTKFDYSRIVALVPKLPNSRRIVLELYFGLNGCQPCSLRRIAKKLGRTEWWAKSKYQHAIREIQKEISIQAPISLVS